MQNKAALQKLTLHGSKGFRIVLRLNKTPTDGAGSPALLTTSDAGSVWLGTCPSVLSSRSLCVVLCCGMWLRIVCEAKQQMQMRFHWFALCVVLVLL